MNDDDFLMKKDESGWTGSAAWDVGRVHHFTDWEGIHHFGTVLDCFRLNLVNLVNLVCPWWDRRGVCGGNMLLRNAS